VQVVDTVGAGDAFVAGFLMSWVNRPRERRELVERGELKERRELDPDDLARAACAAVLVSAAACTVAGANLPDDLVWRDLEPGAVSTDYDPNPQQEG
jgi:sugar/nucleoside kinase (ribokinase family)